VVASAARGGHIHVFRWITGRVGDRGLWKDGLHDAIAIAAIYGHLELIKWLHGRGFSSIRGASSGAGRLAVLKLLQREGDKLTECDQYHLGYAAQSGHLATLQWIHQNFKEADTSYVMAGAARSGDLDMLNWLHQLSGVLHESDGRSCHWRPFSRRQMVV